jgi:hypothetical protein
MSSALTDVTLARLPLESLPLLGEFRRLPGLSVAVLPPLVWARWQPPASMALLSRVLAVRGAELFAERQGHWYGVGAYLPFFDLPDAGLFKPLEQVLFPAPIEAEPPSPVQLVPVQLALVADDQPRQTTAMRCDLAELQKWADSVPSSRLKSLQAAHYAGEALVLGQRLPWLPGAVRFWGLSVFVPLGCRWSPSLPEPALREALKIDAHEFLFATSSGCDAVPRAAFQPLTRGRARLAGQEAAHG